MSAPGVLSLGITFEVATYTGSTIGSYTNVPDLQEIPSLGGEPEKVEITTLADPARRYMKGIKDYGDLEFKFLYDNSASTSAYRKLKSLESESKVSVRVTLPDALTINGHGTQFVFPCDLSVSLDEAGVNDPLTFTVLAGLKGDITVSDPS